MIDQHPENGAGQLNRQDLNGGTAAQGSAPEQARPSAEQATSGSPEPAASSPPEPGPATPSPDQAAGSPPEPGPGTPSPDHARTSPDQAGGFPEPAPGASSPEQAASPSRERVAEGEVDSDRKIVEAILFLADDPIPARQIGEVLERPRTAVEAVLRDLAAEYERDDRGFVLRETAGGWRLYTNPDCHPWLERFAKGHTPARLTGAALEVLAIIAYRGPLSRAQIAEIRGVDSDGVVRTLSARRLIEETGRDSGPGTPVLFGVSRDFLEGMGLRSLDDLPSLKDFMPDAEAVEEMEAKLSPNV
jgi:segregation and condensation protein B